MSDARLLPCPSCARHVRVYEKACPFCSGALSLQAPPLARTPVARLSRAALFALFALGTSAASIAACTSGTGPVGGDAGTGTGTGTGSDSGPEQDLPPDHPPPVADGGILDAAHTLPPKDARED